MPSRAVVRTDRAPAPFRDAPYSQAIRLGDLVFVSGQLSVRPGTSEIVGGDIQQQTEQVMQNLKAILAAAGSSLDRVVKTTVFLVNLADFPGMNEVYSRHVGAAPPARSTVGISALPPGALVEIDAIAHI